MSKLVIYPKLSCGLPAAAVCALLLTASSFAQGTYYPVNPAGAPYGTTYTGTPVVSDATLLFLQQVLQSGMPGSNAAITLQVPIPTGKRAPTTAELTTAVDYATRSLVSGNVPPLANGVVPGPGVTIGSLAIDAIRIKPDLRPQIIGALGTGVLSSGVNASAQVASLDTAVAALAADPGNATSNVSALLAKVVASPDPALPPSVSQLVATAIAQVPDDLVQIQSLTNAGLTNLGKSTLSAADRKTEMLNSYIPALLGSDAAKDNPAVVDALVRSFTNAAGLAVAPLKPALEAALNSILTRDKFEAGAVVTGALRATGDNATVLSAVNAALAGNTAQLQYAKAVINGFQASTGTYPSLVAGNPNADGAAAGAIAANLPVAGVIQDALVSGTANPRDVIYASVSANTNKAVVIAQAAVRGSGGGFQPFGTATFADIVDGAVSAVSAANQVGAIASGLVQKTGSTLQSLSPAATVSIVQGAISAAYQTGKDQAFSDIVAKVAGLTGKTNGLSPSMVTAALQQIDTVTTGDPRYTTSQDRPSYVAVVSALGVETDPAVRNAIRTATLGVSGSLAAVGGDVVAAQSGSDTVEALRTAPAAKYSTMLQQFYQAGQTSSPTNAAQASLYAASLAGSEHLSAALAAAIKESAVNPTLLTEVANNASNQGNATVLRVVAGVAVHAKNTPNDLLDFLGVQIVTNPSFTKDIATAWTVVDPDHAHFVGHAVGFNNPLDSAGAVKNIFAYAQITSSQPIRQGTTTPAASGIVDQPGAAAAIVAGFSSGILETNIPKADRKNAFVKMIAAAVASSITQEGVLLQGAVNPFNNPGDTAQTFRQSNGSTWNGASPIKSGTVRTVGAAGAITGYMAQVVRAGDTSLLQTGETGTVANSISAAVLRSAAINAPDYVLEIAQAAAQAFGWVATPSASVADAVALQIAQAMLPSGKLGGYTQAQLSQAARFGFAEAAAGRIGAGALGLNTNTAVDSNGKPIVKASGNANNEFYIHRSATGTPVTSIFNM